MQKLILNKLTTTLGAVPEVQAVYPPLFEGEFTTYPCVVLQTDSFTNDFQSTDDNFKEYQYKCWVIVQANKNKSASDIASTTLLDTVDAVIAKFDEDWNGGTESGHRLWFRVSTGLMGFEVTDKGKNVYQEMTILAKITTNN